MKLISLLAQGTLQEQLHLHLTEYFRTKELPHRVQAIFPLLFLQANKKLRTDVGV